MNAGDARNAGTTGGPVCAALVVLAIAISTAGIARGAELTAQLDYDASPGCPVAGELKSLVRARLGYDPFRDDAPEQVVVRIERSGTALEGHLEWRNADGNWMGEHKFPSRSGDCGEVVRAMGFALAVQMQLMAAARAEAPRVAPAPPPPAAPTNVTPPAPANVAPAIAAPASAPARASFAMGAGAAVGVALSPNTVAVGRLFGTVSWSRLGLELAAEMSVPTTTHGPDGAGFSLYQAVASVAGCGSSGVFSACLLAKAGQIRVAGEGLDFPATSSALILQAGLRVGVTHRLGPRFYVAGHVDGVTALTRGIVTVDSMPVWTTPRVAGLFGADVGMNFQ